MAALWIQIKLTKIISMYKGLRYGQQNNLVIHCLSVF